MNPTQKQFSLNAERPESKFLSVTTVNRNNRDEPGAIFNLTVVNTLDHMPQANTTHRESLSDARHMAVWPPKARCGVVCQVNYDFDVLHKMG